MISFQQRIGSSKNRHICEEKSLAGENVRDGRIEKVGTSEQVGRKDVIVTQKPIVIYAAKL